MTSIRSSLLNISTRVLMGIVCRRARSPLWFRDVSQRFDAMSSIKLASQISVEESSTDIPGWHLRNNDAAGAKTILYLHGGAFIMHMPHAYKSMLGRICAATGMSAFMPSYRLAPEDPFPAAPEDCLTAYRGLLAEGTAACDIVVMGDSAGGNLALVFLSRW
jgi:monoterpene epsilon-lactone hydrolase